MPEAWRVIRAEGGHEFLAGASIKELRIEIYLPLYVMRKRYGRRSELVKTALLPGYLFAYFGDDHPRWPDIYRCRGVAGGDQATLCDAAMRPRPVPDVEMEIVRTEAAKYEGIVYEEVPLEPMQVVRIIEGLFIGRAARIAQDWNEGKSPDVVPLEIEGRRLVLHRNSVAPAA